MGLPKAFFEVRCLRFAKAIHDSFRIAGLKKYNILLFLNPYT